MPRRGKPVAVKDSDEQYLKDMAAQHAADKAAELAAVDGEDDINVPQSEDRLTIHAMGNCRVVANIGTREKPKMFPIVINGGMTVVSGKMATDHGTTLAEIAAAIKKHPGNGGDYMITGGPGAVTGIDAQRFIKVAMMKAEKRRLKTVTGARNANE